MKNTIYGATTTTPVPVGGGNVNLDEYVKNTDYATNEKFGIVKIGTGLTMAGNGVLQIQYADENSIKEKVGYRYPITPVFLDIAVKTGVTTNTITLTDEEKAAACEWLGINALAIPNTVIGGGKSISVSDVSPLAHKCSCTLTSDTYSEIVGGSNNILNYNKSNINADVNKEWGNIFTDNEDGSFVLNGTVPAYEVFSLRVRFDNLQDDETYTVSIRNSKNEALIFSLEKYFKNGDGVPMGNEVTTQYTFTKGEDDSYYLLTYTFDKAVWGEAQTLNNEILYVQIEKGEVMTEWQPAGGSMITKPYIEDFSTVKVIVGGKSYTPSKDGLVTNIISTSPTMEVTTDNKYANIHDFAYCVDTKKYIDNKFEELKAQLTAE